LERKTPDMTPIYALMIFVLATFVGLEVITKIPKMLHTPLMSATNAIHGIVILGAIVSAGMGGTVGAVVGTLSLIAAAINVVGGFLVTDRMLQMFKREK
jgi:H+-translocating NAD(P) transhydrogenase subunit alpha